MDIRTFAREQWGRDERDPQAAAEAYLRAALESRDAYSALIQSVRSAMAGEFRSLRRGLEQQALPWDAPGRPGAARQVFPAGQLIAEERLTLTDKRAVLLREQVWTVTRGMVLWADITVEDIEKTIEEYRQVANGIDLKIERLDSARRVMQRHGAARLGDVPWQEIIDVVRA